MHEGPVLGDDSFSRVVALNAKVNAIRDKAEKALRRAEGVRLDLHILKDKLDRILTALPIGCMPPLAANDPTTTHPLSSSQPLLVAVDAIGLQAASLPRLTEDLCAAYETAREDGDEAKMQIIGTALWHLGQHYAEQIGPRAAGVAVN
jgi:hypothetical protein